MAEIKPFPLTRHGREGDAFVAKVARRMAILPSQSAEKHLEANLRRKADIMESRGIDEATIEAELNAARSAIRSALVRAIVGGVA